MDSLEVKNTEEHPVEMFVDQPPFLEPLHPEEVYVETRVFPRVGDEYQVEVPDLATEEERIKLRLCPVDEGRMFGFEYPIGIGIAIPVMWTPDSSHYLKEEQKEIPGHCVCPPQDECKKHTSGNMLGNSYQHSICPQSLDCKVESSEQASSDKLSKSVGQDRHCLQNGKFSGRSSIKRKFKEYMPLPGMPASSWTDAEAQTFLLALYIFGKNLVQVMNFVENKTMGDVLSYYYGKFFRSDAYRRWTACRKVRSRRCILGLRIFSGPRQQELLSRLLVGVAAEVQEPLLEVFKTFNEGTSTFEQFILTLKSIVGARVLVEAVGIGKGKHDLTGFALDPSRNHGIPTRPEIPIGKACSSLSSGDIIKFLTGDFRLSKAKSNDLFWEAVWPRLLARGWHSEQPKDQAPVSKHALVFLIPGIKKFSRRKLVKGNHYFDSVSDVLSKVASDPRLLELEVEGANDEGGFELENGWIRDTESEKNTLPDQKPPCYLQPRVPGCTPDLMKFTVVDTSLVQGEELSKVRSLRNLPLDVGHGYVSLPFSGDSGSDNTEEHSDSEDSSPSPEYVNTNQNITDSKDLNEDKCRLPMGDGMHSDVLQKMSALSNTMVPINGHTSINQGFNIMNSTSSSTATMINFNNQIIHSSSTEISFQLDQRVNPGPQVFLAPVSKRRRLGACKNERTGQKNFVLSKNHYRKQDDTPLQQGTSRANEPNSDANCFIWGAFPNSSTKTTLHENNNHEHCGEFRHVPPNDGTRIHKEKPQDQHVIDLNLPQMPSDYETTASCFVPPSDKKSVPDADKPVCPSEADVDDYLPYIDASTHALLSEQLAFNSRRQSTRSHPPTARVLEALACGFIGTKQKSREANFPSSSRSSRSVRRPRRSAEVAVPFPSEDSKGSNFHFADPATAAPDWHTSNSQFQIFPSKSDKSTDKGCHQLFGVP